MTFANFPVTLYSGHRSNIVVSGQKILTIDFCIKSQYLKNFYTDSLMM